MKRQFATSPTIKGKDMPHILHLGAIIAGSGATRPEVNSIGEHESLMGTLEALSDLAR